VIALAEAPPTPEALALGPTIGWLLFACVIAFCAIVVIDRERWRKFWLRTEDPRAMAAFRIAFATVLLININNMWDHFEFLFTDEGLYLTDSARQHLAGGQFKGYGEGIGDEPTGFFDVAAFLAWAKGPRYSLLYWWDSPRAFWIQLWVFEIATVAFLLGFRTRLAGFVSLVLTLGFMNRSPIYQSGADVVFRVMFVYLVLAQTGRAYSIDNWLRCRRLRKQGLLSERDGPGAGAGVPGQLEAIYRRIPGWPRMLMIIQLATIYLWTGSAKTGDVWWKGDSLYYALSLDHFARVPTQYMVYIFGTNLFRLMTWTVHYWQIGFFLMVLGLIVRWARRERLEPPSGWRRHALRGAWIVLGLGGLVITWVGLPVHVPAESPIAISTVQWLVAGIWLAMMAGIGWGWWRLREQPFTLKFRQWSYRLDLERFFALVFGRRWWLTLGIIFHLHILVLMNIGMFAPVMIVSYFVALNGTEVALLLRRFGHGLARLRVPGIPAWVARGERITPTEDPACAPHHDGRRLPDAVLAISFGFAALAVLAKVHENDRWWWGLALALTTPMLVAIARRLREQGQALTPVAEPWAYGWFGRTWIATLLILHVIAVATWAIPDKGCTASFRKPARQVVARWLNVTETYQSWNMFAPNPSRSNVFMNVYVTTRDGETWDLHTDANSPRNKANPWWIYDRMGKITRQVTGEGKQYTKWIARYHCRTWALEHEGELPLEVEIVKQWYAIPSPDRLRKIGPYDPSEYLAKHGKTEVIYTAWCAREPDGQPTAEQRVRHGLPEVPDSQIKRAVRPRWQAWQRERAREEELEVTGD
jgi:hypothetical protein